MHKIKEISPFDMVWKDLQAKYKGLSLEGLAKLSKTIELDIQYMIIFLINEYFSQIETFKSLKPLEEFMLDGALYVIRCGPRINEPVLEIYIIAAIDSKQESNHIKENIGGFGYYESFELFVPNKLNMHMDPLIHLIKQIFNAGYRWLEKCFFENVAEIEKGFAKELYSYTRAALTNSGRKESLAEEIWFSVWTKNNGYYLLDGQAINAIINLLEKRGFVSELSPIEHAIEIIRLVEPYEKSLSQYAIKDDAYREFALNKAAYMLDMSNVYKTEEQMVKGSAFAVFPIGKVGSYILCAGFPSNLHDELLPFFEVNKIQLVDIYTKESKLLARHIDNLKTTYNRMINPEFGGFVGAFFGEFIKAFILP